MQLLLSSSSSQSFESSNVKVLIKSELQRLYPGYNPVATLPNMLDYNIDTLAKEISQEK